MLFHLPTGKLKTFMNFYNSFGLFCLLIYLCLNKSFDVLDRRLNMSLATKVKVAKFSFLMKSDIITKQLLTSISVDIRIYLPKKVIVHRGR